MAISNVSNSITTVRINSLPSVVILLPPLIRGGNKITTEGKEFIRTVVIEFETFEIAKNFFYSDEYQSAHAILGGSVTRNHQIIEGA